MEWYKCIGNNLIDLDDFLGKIPQWLGIKFKTFNFVEKTKIGKVNSKLQDVLTSFQKTTRILSVVS
jgi:hypothetical protein